MQCIHPIGVLPPTSPPLHPQFDIPEQWQPLFTWKSSTSSVFWLVWWSVVSLEAHWLPFTHGKKWGDSTMWSIRWDLQISWCPLLCLFSILRPEAVQVSWILSLSNSRLIKQAGSRQSRFFSSKMQGCSPNHKKSLQRWPGTMPVLIHWLEVQLARIPRQKEKKLLCQGDQLVQTATPQGFFCANIGALHFY